MKKFASCLMALVLTGCQTTFSERVSCPKAVILAEFSKTVDLNHKEPIRSEIDSLSPHCTKDETMILVEFKMRITSLRSLASSHDLLKIKPSYFVAVVDKSGKVLSRSNHTFDVTFDAKQTTKVSFQELQERVPADQDVTLYVGFNLEEPQIKYFQNTREGKLHQIKRH